MNLFDQLFQTVQSLFITIPINNAFGAAYVVLNFLSQIFALFAYGGSSSGGGLLGGGTGGGLF